jgi:hypothetical protein
MKFATVVLLGILLLGSSVSLNAQPAAISQVVTAYINETPLPDPIPNDGNTGLCLVYYTMIGDLGLNSLFTLDTLGYPQVDRQHAYFIWVSDYNWQSVPANPKAPPNPNTVFSVTMILQGTATIYYTAHPENRVFDSTKDPARSTWGDPVAKFVRKTGMFQSLDGGNSGTFANTAELVSSKPFPFQGKTFNLKDVIPQGMTCFETIVGPYEAGTCVAIK